MKKQRALDYHNYAIVDQLYDAIISKLNEREKERLTGSQEVVGSNPISSTKGLNR